MNKEKDNDDIKNVDDKPSYTYWKRQSDDPFSNQFQPQKSSGSLGDEETNNSNKYGSAWNKAGTWYLNI
jgi:hypothetical protein